tara:strand:- start:16421 stop:17221 length:801 start_codon:yes stop_codon:yes gene_type:complete
MSRINRPKGHIASDGTENQSVYNKGVSKRIYKKIGHKGDYADIKFTSPFISSVKTGGGTDENPYVYTLDVNDTLINSISSNKADLLKQMDESKEINSKANIVERKRLDMIVGFKDMFSFNIDLKELSCKMTNIGNSDVKNIQVRKATSKQKTKRDTVNNMFSVGGDFKLPLKCSIKHNLKIESKNKINSNAPTPCEYGYKVHVKKGSDGSSFDFHITYKNFPITFEYLKEKIKNKMKSISIDFLVEYNGVSNSAKASGARVMAGGY